MRKGGEKKKGGGRGTRKVKKTGYRKVKARTGHTDYDADKQKKHRLGWGQIDVLLKILCWFRKG